MTDNNTTPVIKGLKGMYSENSGIDLSGTPEALLALSKLFSTLDNNPATVLLDDPDRDVSPYDYALRRLTIEQIEEAKTVVIQREDDTLRITGPAELLSTVAENAAGLSEGPVEPQGRGHYHIHIEYFPDHYYLDPSSEPLVLSLEGA